MNFNETYIHTYKKQGKHGKNTFKTKQLLSKNYFFKP